VELEASPAEEVEDRRDVRRRAPVEETLFGRHRLDRGGERPSGLARELEEVES